MIRLDDVHLKLASAAGEVNILKGIDLTVGVGADQCADQRRRSGERDLAGR